MCSWGGRPDPTVWAAIGRGVSRALSRAGWWEDALFHFPAHESSSLGPCAVLARTVARRGCCGWVAASVPGVEREGGWGEGKDLNPSLISSSLNHIFMSKEVINQPCVFSPQVPVSQCPSKGQSACCQSRHPAVVPGCLKPGSKTWCFLALPGAWGLWWFGSHYKLQNIWAIIFLSIPSWTCPSGWVFAYVSSWTLWKTAFSLKQRWSCGPQGSPDPLSLRLSLPRRCGPGVWFEKQQRSSYLKSLSFPNDFNAFMNH